MPSRLYHSLAALIALAGPATASAATFCADTAEEIAAAMDAAKENGEDDEIRIVAGNYLLTETLRLGNVETESFALAFSGRWNADCSEPSAGGASTLNGDGERQLLALSLDAQTDISIRDLAFVNGFAAFNASGGVLDLVGGRDLAIERVQVYGSLLENGEAPLHVDGGGPGSVLQLRNNLVFDNTAEAMTGVHIESFQGAAHITGNTITANESAIPCPCSGLNYAGTSAYTVSNNLVWGNEGGDVFINPLNAVHLHNDIGQLTTGSNPPGPGSSGDISIFPLFAGDGVHLLPASQLVNAGVAETPGGIGELDGARGDRLVGAGVDIGALETDVLFRDGFGGVPAP
jgi:hypothetical protein